MPRFDMPGRDGPLKIHGVIDGCRRVFDMPYQTEDSAEIALLLRHGAVASPLKPIHKPEPPKEADTKTPRKEVEEQ